jgi:protein tyrosine phosphatase
MERRSSKKIFLTESIKIDDVENETVSSDSSDNSSEDDDVMHPIVPKSRSHRHSMVSDYNQLQSHLAL